MASGPQLPSACVPAMLLSPAKRPRSATPAFLPPLHVPMPAPTFLRPTSRPTSGCPAIWRVPHAAIARPRASLSPAAPNQEKASTVPVASEDRGVPNTVATPSESGGGEAAVSGRSKRGPRSSETKRKIAFAMIGQPKSDAMRAKVSKKLKGRVPWNKGKKLSAETRERMSRARFGRNPWNIGRALSSSHRSAISAATKGVPREISPATRKRLRMARRRPGDSVVAGGKPTGTANGDFPLLESTDINVFVSLRRELRTWSDAFARTNDRRPTLADVRRTAQPTVIGKFERYIAMRAQLRGLAADVYDKISPESVPGVRPADTASAQRNNNRYHVRYTSNGNARLVPKIRSTGSEEDVLAKDGGQYDKYDFASRGDYSSGFQRSETVVREDPESFPAKAKARNAEMNAADHAKKLSANDYRAIGKFRLIESVDINRYVQLRRELIAWSAKFKKEHERTPTLSDVLVAGDPRMYRRFQEYIKTRDHMDGLVKEVCGASPDDVEEIQKVTQVGRKLVDKLRPHSQKLTQREAAGSNADGEATANLESRHGDEVVGAAQG